MIARETRIYQRAIEMHDIIQLVVARLPARQRGLADQLERASSSVVMQFVEGFGQKSARHRAAYFCVARGSANECAAALDIARRRVPLDAELFARGIDAAEHVAAMLTRFK